MMMVFMMIMTMMIMIMKVPVFYLMEADQGGEELFAQAGLEKGLIKQSFQNVKYSLLAPISIWKRPNKNFNSELFCNHV